MKKLSKWIAIVVISLVATFGYKVFSVRHMVRAPGGERYPIPKEIVDSKDCSAYYKFLDTLVRPGFVPNTPCPWFKGDEIGHFEINGVKLDVPRKFIWFRSHQPDGKSEGLNLWFTFPEMTPGKDLAPFTVAASIRPIDKPGGCRSVSDSECKEWLKKKYYVRSSYWLFLMNPQKYADKNLINKGPLMHTDLTMYWRDMVKNPENKAERPSDEVFVRGNYRNPEIWYVCNTDDPRWSANPGCETEILINNKLSIHYSFRRRHLLEKHHEVREILLKTIDSFIQEQGEEYD